MKNILLLITDTYRYDNLGERAARPVRTPALDRFAAERATEIHGMYAGSFPTIPHRTDVTTGVLGWPHYGWQALAASAPNHAPALLREQGYRSQLLCDCPHLFNAGFQGAFDAAYQNRGQEGDVHFLHLNDEIRQTMPPEKTRGTGILGVENLADVHRWNNRYFTREDQTFAYRTGNLAVQWLEENHRAGPWFLWVDFFDPHEPWDPPEYLVRRYDPEYVGTPMIHPNYGRIDVYTPEELHNLWAHYAAEAELVDRALGRVLQKLDDLQLWDETLVAVTSDHGFSIGDHGRAGKTGLGDRSASHWPLYPEISHVPFLLAGGGVPAGGSLDLLAQPMDILPTLAELAGVTLAPAQDFDGSSFAAAVRSGQGGHRDVAVCGGFVGDDAADELPARSTTPFVVSGRWGYTPHGVEAAEELYDLDADPWAETNVAEGNAAVLREMNGKLVEYLRAHRASDRTIARWRR